MTAEIKERLGAQPFVPFTIRMADGREYAVPTPDHAHVSPQGRRVAVFAEDDRQFILPASLISGVGVDSEQATQ
jgi:hypothetical protein